MLKGSFFAHVFVHVYVPWTHHICAGMLNIPIQGQGGAFSSEPQLVRVPAEFTLECEIKVVSLASR